MTSATAAAVPPVSPAERVGRLRRELVFAAAVVATGVASGVAGVLVTLLLHAVQHTAFGYTENTFLQGVEQAGPVRRVVAVGVGGALVGLGWWAHRRYLCRRIEVRDISVTHALARPAHRLPLVATTTDALLQIVAVGAGGSIGREGAPRQVGGALGATLGRALRLKDEHRRIVLAAGAGAGLAAVYNVPLGGALFTLEVLLRSRAPRACGTALATAGIATVVAWPFLGTRATYSFPHQSAATGAVLVAALVAPLIGALGTPLAHAFRLLTRWARTSAPQGWRAAVAMAVTFTALGALAIPFPQLLGNGKGLAQLDLDGPVSLALAVELMVLKPLATAACLRSGAIGGLLTPSFATGATFGLVLAQLWTMVAPSAPATSFSLLGAAAVLAVTQRAPLTAVVLAVEFAHPPAALLPAVALAVAGAVTAGRIARWLRQRTGALRGGGQPKAQTAA